VGRDALLSTSKAKSLGCCCLNVDSINGHLQVSSKVCTHCVNVVGKTGGLRNNSGVDISHLPRDAVEVGDPAYLLGPLVDADALAKAAGTIGYELLTGVTSRVPRSSIDSTSHQE